MLRYIRNLSLSGSLVSGIAIATVPATLAAQSDILIQARSGSPQSDRFRVDSAGGLVALGAAMGMGANCVIPASGSGTRFMWYPCRGSFRFGRVPSGGTNWDNAYVGDFTFAGGDEVTASGKAAFAFGEKVTVSGDFGAGFGPASRWADCTASRRGSAPSAPGPPAPPWATTRTPAATAPWRSATA